LARKPIDNSAGRKKPVGCYTSALPKEYSFRAAFSTHDGPLLRGTV